MCLVEGWRTGNSPELDTGVTGQFCSLLPKWSLFEGPGAVERSRESYIAQKITGESSGVFVFDSYVCR